MVRGAVRGVILAGLLFAGDVPAKEIGVLVDPAMVQDPGGEPRPAAVSAAWLAYSLAKAAAHEEALKSASGNGTPDDFAVEFAGRRALALTWRGARGGESPAADAYLDQLVAIDDAGFMDEYVLASFANPGWVVPAPVLGGLEPASFGRWAEANVPELQSPIYGRVEAEEGAAGPAVPGAALPDPDELSPGRLACTEVSAPLQRAVAAWEAEAAKLAATPVAVADPGQFLWSLAAIGGREPARSRGAIWVSMRPAVLAFMAGYCAVDVRDYALAEVLLGTAAALMPLDANPRMELAQALIGQAKLDQADALVTEIMGATSDPCATARAWRKRGFIRFEQGLLEEARAAYRKSLEFEPDSPLAKSELQAIDAEIRRTGGQVDDYQPPPSWQVSTQCAP